MSDTDAAQISTEADTRSQTMLGGVGEGADHAAAPGAATGQPQGEVNDGTMAEAAVSQPGRTYAEFTLPQGIEIDAASMTEAKKLFAVDGLSQERAQSYVDLYASRLKEATEEPYRLWAETQRDWQTTVKTDREIGGARLAANLAIASKAIERFGGDALRQALNVSGAGNHPDVIRAFIRIGKAISEDSLVLGRGVVHDTRNRAERLYPNDPLKPRE